MSSSLEKLIRVRTHKEAILGATEREVQGWLQRIEELRADLADLDEEIVLKTPAPDDGDCSCGLERWHAGRCRECGTCDGSGDIFDDEGNIGACHECAAEGRI